MFGVRGQVRFGVHQETLTLGDLRELHQRVLVFWHDLQYLLKECRRLWQQIAVAQLLRNKQELVDRFLGLAGLHVEIAEPVGGGPVVWALLENLGVGCDRAVDPPLPEHPVGAVQGSVYCHIHTFTVSGRRTTDYRSSAAVRAGHPLRKQYADQTDRSDTRAGKVVK